MICIPGPAPGGHWTMNGCAVGWATVMGVRFMCGGGGGPPRDMPWLTGAPMTGAPVRSNWPGTPLGIGLRLSSILVCAAMHPITVRKTRSAAIWMSWEASWSSSMKVKKKSQALQVVLAADDLIVARVRLQFLLVHDHEAGCGGAQAGAAEGLEAEAALVVSVTHRPRPEAAYVHVALAAHVAFNRAAEGLLPQEVDGARRAEEAKAAPGGLLAR